MRAVLMSVALAVASSGCSRSAPETAVAPGTPATPHTVINALIWAPDWPDEMHMIAEAFNHAHPQIHVNVQFMIGNSVEENIQPRVASNNMPDLLSVNPNAYAASLAEQGVLIDLENTPAWDDMLDRLKPDWTTESNKHFGVSGGVAATLIYYNTAMFKQAGITVLPTDFDSFLKVCAKLKKAGFTPIVWSGGFPNMLGNGPFASGFANNVVAREPQWKRKIADGSLNLDTAAVADIFSKMKLVAQRGYVQDDYMTTGYDANIKLFTDGKAAMTFDGTWASGMLMKDQGFVTGTFIPPWNATGKTPVPILGSETGFAIAATRNRKAALQFLEFMMGPGFSIQQARRHNIAPLKHLQGKAVADPRIVDYVQRISAYPVTASPYYSFLPAATIDLTHALMQESMLNKITAAQAAAGLDRSIKNEALRKNH